MDVLSYLSFLNSFERSRSCLYNNLTKKNIKKKRMQMIDLIKKLSQSFAFFLSKQLFNSNKFRCVCLYLTMTLLSRKTLLGKKKVSASL